MSEQRLIDKDDIIAFIKANGYVYANTLENFPEVEAVPVVRGKWIIKDDRVSFKSVKPFFFCSECNVKRNSRSRFCPSCGAKMDKE